MADVLTEQKRLFAAEYLIDLNGKQAAIRAGYSEKTAEQQASRLLSSVKVQEYIQELMDERSKRTQITADRVLQEYAKLGFSNITDYLKVEETDMVIDFVGEGENKKPVMQKIQSVRIFDTDAIDRVKLDAVAEIKQTKEGIALKLHDKKGALDSIARHLGMFNDKIEHSGQMTNKIDLSGISDEVLRAYAKTKPRAN